MGHDRVVCDIFTKDVKVDSEDGKKLSQPQEFKCGMFLCFFLKVKSFISIQVTKHNKVSDFLASIISLRKPFQFYCNKNN